MNTFTKLVEKNETVKKYKVSSYLVLKINAESEGEAGYISDSIIESLENYDSHIINNIEEINSFDKNLNENKLVDIAELFRTMPKELSPEEKIKRAWKEKFDNKEVSKDDKFEFYHQARKIYEGDTIFKALKESL